MKFIAIPVGMGDAFYAKTSDGFRVLVDGGGSRQKLPRLFCDHTRERCATVVICTHNDSDHAKGIIGFLESHLECCELWLPATWIETLLNLPKNTYDTERYLLESLATLVDQVWMAYAAREVQIAATPYQWLFGGIENQPSGLSEIGDAESMEQDDRPVFLSMLFAPMIRSLEEHLELFSRWQREPSLVLSQYLPWWHCLPDLVRLEASRDLAKVGKDACHLLTIARHALRRELPVRCFQHDPQYSKRTQPVKGTPLLPLSARPVYYLRPHKRQGSPKEFFYLLALTTVNRQSLVFYLHPQNAQPGILFTADSDLEDVDVSVVAKGSIVTAPHHGSTSNRKAYHKINGPVLWVRSDGRGTSGPCQEFLCAAGRRFCTLCRSGTGQKQAVRLYTRRRSWVPWRTQPCNCR